MKYKLLIAIFFIGIISISGCIVGNKNKVECKNIKDCEGQKHEDCEGSWECENNKCIWVCIEDLIPPALPE